MESLKLAQPKFGNMVERGLILRRKQKDAGALPRDEVTDDEAAEAQ